jgi:hypothetical protein
MRKASGTKDPVAKGEEAARAAQRLRSIRDALSGKDVSKLDPETQVLMLRTLAVERLGRGRAADALQIARRMLPFGVLTELAHHEAARAHAALDDHAAAAASDRLAARSAPPEQRSFFWWSVATHWEHAGDVVQATDALRRASRWASAAARPLYRAHLAALRLEHGEVVRDVKAIVSGLEESPQGQGYGGYLLGRIAEARGDGGAAAHFQAFLDRHEHAEPAQRITLAIELKDAERRLARLGRLEP